MSVLRLLYVNQTGAIPLLGGAGHSINYQQTGSYKREHRNSRVRFRLEPPCKTRLEPNEKENGVCL